MFSEINDPSILSSPALASLTVLLNESDKGGAAADTLLRSMANTPDEKGRYPIHLLMSHGEKAGKGPLKIWMVEKLLRYHPLGLQAKDNNGLLPIHYLSLYTLNILSPVITNASTPCSSFVPPPPPQPNSSDILIEILRYYNRNYSRGIRTKDNHGLLPLHYFSRFLKPPPSYSSNIDFPQDNSINQVSNLSSSTHWLSPLEILISFYPEALSDADKEGWIPLHHACQNSGSVELIQCLILRYAGGLREKTFRGSLPLHCAAEKNNNIIIISYLLSQYSNGASEKGNNNLLPLHCTVRGNSNFEIFEYIYSSFPQAIHIPDSLGRLPIHLAIKNPYYLKNNEEIFHKDKIADEEFSSSSFVSLSILFIKYFLRQDYSLISAKDLKGWYPLTYAVKYFNNDSLDLFYFLYEAYPQALYERDSDGWTILHHAASNPSISIDFIILLIKLYPEAAAMKEWSFKNRDKNATVNVFPSNNGVGGIAGDSFGNNLYEQSNGLLPYQICQDSSEKSQLLLMFYYGMRYDLKKKDDSIDVTRVHICGDNFSGKSVVFKWLKDNLLNLNNNTNIFSNILSTTSSITSSTTSSTSIPNSPLPSAASLTNNISSLFDQPFDIISTNTANIIGYNAAVAAASQSSGQIAIQDSGVMDFAHVSVNTILNSNEKSEREISQTSHYLIFDHSASAYSSYQASPYIQKKKLENLVLKNKLKQDHFEEKNKSQENEENADSFSNKRDSSDDYEENETNEDIEESNININDSKEINNEILLENQFELMINEDSLFLLVVPLYDKVNGIKFSIDFIVERFHIWLKKIYTLAKKKMFSPSSTFFTSNNNPPNFYYSTDSMKNLDERKLDYEEEDDDDDENEYDENIYNNIFPPSFSSPNHSPTNGFIPLLVVLNTFNNESYNCSNLSGTSQSQADYYEYIREIDNIKNILINEMKQIYSCKTPYQISLDQSNKKYMTSISDGGIGAAIAASYSASNLSSVSSTSTISEVKLKKYHNLIPQPTNFSNSYTPSIDECNLDFLLIGDEGYEGISIGDLRLRKENKKCISDLIYKYSISSFSNSRIKKYSLLEYSWNIIHQLTLKNLIVKNELKMIIKSIIKNYFNQFKETSLILQENELKKIEKKAKTSPIEALYLRSLDNRYKTKKLKSNISNIVINLFYSIITRFFIRIGKLCFIGDSINSFLHYNINYTQNLKIHDDYLSSDIVRDFSQFLSNSNVSKPFFLFSPFDLPYLSLASMINFHVENIKPNFNNFDAIISPDQIVQWFSRFKPTLASNPQSSSIDIEQLLNLLIRLNLILPIDFELETSIIKKSFPSLISYYYYLFNKKALYANNNVTKKKSKKNIPYCLILPLISSRMSLEDINLFKKESIPNEDFIKDSISRAFLLPVNGKNQDNGGYSFLLSFFRYLTTNYKLEIPRNEKTVYDNINNFDDNDAKKIIQYDHNSLLFNGEIVSIYFWRDGLHITNKKKIFDLQNVKIYSGENLLDENSTKEILSNTEQYIELITQVLILPWNSSTLDKTGYRVHVIQSYSPYPYNAENNLLTYRLPTLHEDSPFLILSKIRSFIYNFLEKKKKYFNFYEYGLNSFTSTHFSNQIITTKAIELNQVEDYWYLNKDKENRKSIKIKNEDNISEDEQDDESEEELFDKDNTEVSNEFIVKDEELWEMLLGGIEINKNIRTHLRILTTKENNPSLIKFYSSLTQIDIARGILATLGTNLFTQSEDSLSNDICYISNDKLIILIGQIILNACRYRKAVIAGANYSFNGILNREQLESSISYCFSLANTLLFTSFFPLSYPFSTFFTSFMNKFSYKYPLYTSLMLKNNNKNKKTNINFPFLAILNKNENISSNSSNIISYSVNFLCPICGKKAPSGGFNSNICQPVETSNNYFRLPQDKLKNLSLQSISGGLAGGSGGGYNLLTFSSLSSEFFMIFSITILAIEKIIFNKENLLKYISLLHLCDIGNLISDTLDILLEFAFRVEKSREKSKLDNSIDPYSTDIYVNSLFFISSARLLKIQRKFITIMNQYISSYSTLNQLEMGIKKKNSSINELIGDNIKISSLVSSNVNSPSLIPPSFSVSFSQSIKINEEFLDIFELFFTVLGDNNQLHTGLQRVFCREDGSTSFVCLPTFSNNSTIIMSPCYEEYLKRGRDSLIIKLDY